MPLSESTAEFRKRLAQLSTEERDRLVARLNADRSGTAVPDMRAPLSYQQRNFWILHQMAEHPETYNSALVARLSGRLDPETLRTAVLTVTRQYRIYRTVYVETPTGVEPIFRDDLLPEYHFEDVDASAIASEEAVLSAIRGRARRPFRLDKECPVRIVLYRLDEQHFYLGLIFHHIANDGGSFNLFWEAIRETYEALVRGDDLPRVEMNRQYESFSRSQAARTNRSDVDEALRYWVSQLDGAPTSAGFTYDFPAGNGPTEDACEVVLPIGMLEERAGALARAESTTRNVVYLAAYFAWLFHETGSTDEVVGVPIDGRMRRDDGQVLGCCINMLSIRQRLSPSWTFLDLIRETRRVMLDGIRHSDLPFLRLVEEMERSSGGTFGFYDTTFQYRNFIEKLAPVDGVEAEVLFLPRHASQFPVMLEIFPHHGVPRVSLTYETRLLRKETAERMLRRYVALLDAAITSPDCALSDMGGPDDEERRLVAGIWSRNPRSYPTDATVHQLFTEQVTRCPDAPALLYDGRLMTYTELDDASSKLAAALKHKGILAGSRIGLCVERSFDLVVSLLAILKCGAAYVPLDGEYPPARLRFMIEDAALCGILTDQANHERIRNLGARTLLLTSLRAPATVEAESVPISAPDPAYLMYTSGTTGKPKGVLVPHRGIVRLVRGADYAELGTSETFLHLSSPSFDAATFEIWAPLLNGGRLVLMPPRTPSIRDIGEMIRTGGVTTLWLTAGLFHLIVDEDPSVLQPLRQLLAGGDVLSPEHVRRCLQACPSLRLINGYGPTENTTFSCCYPIPRAVSFSGSIPIGRPIANSEAYVLDERRRPVSIGIVGELYVGGAGLALGYWRRPELTRERFVGHPFSDDPNARLYRTGDRARFLPDGTIEYMGRLDQQVKVRGFRVELSEIESVVVSAPGVRQCAAMTRTEGTPEIVAYVVVDRDDEAVIETARAVARESLPSYMMPAKWVVLSSLPLTRNGKVDKRRLPTPDRASDRASEPPANELEWQLLEIFRRLFQMDEIGCDDDFFELGGDSFTAIRFVAEAERWTERRIGLSRLFQHPTVRSFARDLMRDSSAPRWTSLVPLARGGEGLPLFIPHGVGGELFALKKFGRQVGGNRPVFGLQAIEHAGAQQRFPSFESMAAHYVAEIRSIQASGPYFLFGFSLGGMIAFEIASQLRRSGEKVGMLFLLDAHPPNLPAGIRLRVMAPYWRGRLVRHVAAAARSGSALAFLWSRWTAFRRQFTSPYGAGGSDGEYAAIVPPRMDYYQAIGHRYVPRPTDLPVTLIQAADNRRNLYAAWSYLSRQHVSVLRVPGRHLDLLSGDALETTVQLVRDRLSVEEERAFR